MKQTGSGGHSRAIQLMNWWPWHRGIVHGYPPISQALVIIIINIHFVLEWPQRVLAHGVMGTVLRWPGLMFMAVMPGECL